MTINRIRIRKPVRTEGLSADIYLPLTLGTNSASLGKDEEISSYIREETKLAIPAIKDYELSRYKLALRDGTSRAFTPYFLDKTGVYQNSYQAANHTDLAVATLSQSLTRSLYIFELFDTDDVDKQVLLTTSFAKATDNNTYLPVFSANGSIVSNNPYLGFVENPLGQQRATDLSSISIPNYITQTSPKGVVYLRISFFNPITAKKTRFRRNDSSLSIAENAFIPLTYDASTRTYQLPTGGDITLLEVPIASTSGEAEAERKRRIANMTATVELGIFEPLGNPQ